MLKKPNKLYRLYIDESGDHTYGKKTASTSIVNSAGAEFHVPNDEYPKLSDIRNRYLSLTGCIIEKTFYCESFKPEMEKLKKRHFDYDIDDPLIFHREDMVQHRGAFWKLKDEEKRKSFDADLLSFLKQMPYRIITTVIDKQAHIQKYRGAAFHPYHYCLTVMLERYCGFLSFSKSTGDVMAESRGGKEDEKLKRAYHDLYLNGTNYWKKGHFQNTLTSKHIKLQKKTQNIAGLQLSDLLAHPARCAILAERGCMLEKQDFGTVVMKTVENKFNRHHYSRSLSDLRYSFEYIAVT